MSELPTTRRGVLGLFTAASAAGVRLADPATTIRSIGDINGVDPTGATDSAVGIQKAIDAGGEIVFPRGTYAIKEGLVVSGVNTRLRFESGATLTYTDPTLTAITLDASGCQIDGAIIVPPAIFDATNDPPTYAVIRVNAHDCTVSNVTMRNVPRVGIWFKDCNNGRVVNCHIDGGLEEGFYTGANTFHYGIFIDPAGSGGQGNFIVANSIIRRCVQGAGSGNFGSESLEQSMTITGNVFELCWNHGVYSPGIAHGVTVSGNAFNACQVPVALTGRNHVIDGNTLIVQTTGSGAPTDNEVTGISLRDPYGCVVTNNSIKGEGTAGSACLSLEEHSGVPGINTVENNIVSGNVVEITNTDAASVTAIRVAATNSVARNNIVSDNTIKAPIRENLGLISVYAQAGSPSSGNSVNNNTIVITGGAGTGYGIYLSNITDSDISGNKVRLEYDADAAVALSAIAWNACQRLLIGSNIVRCPAEHGGNIDFRAFQELTSGSGNEVVLNKVALDPAKLADARVFVLLTTSGTRVEHAGPGSPEGAVVSGVGGLWRRTDGSAGTTLYVKESGTGNGGWVGK